MDNMIYWIWLSLSVTHGTTTFAKLCQIYSEPKEIYDLGEEDYKDILGSRCADIRALCDKELDSAEQIYNFCINKKVGLLTYADERYPKLLREISNPPVLLYYRGTLPDFNSQCFVSVVGTRRLTDYGRRNAYSLSFDLARAGAIIVSGMAIGIDGVAMAGAIAAGGTTVAVLGSGIDVCYPEVHKTLAREIVKNGCVLTEYPPRTPPSGKNFPRRNRIISGLSAATIVIEGRESSGSIITAKCAKQQGRAVYALPGNVDNKTSEVSNLLIQNGAKLITCAENFISDFEFVYTGKLNPFNLIDSVDMQMSQTLKHLEISCVAPSDNIFSTYPKASKGKKVNQSNSKRDENTELSDAALEEAQNKEADLAGFDKKMLEIYRKIPIQGDCSIESLCTDDCPMREVMRIIMKLQMNCFVKMLPSDRVKRNLT